MTVDIEILTILVKPLLQKSKCVYVAEGCGRVYVATVPSTKCLKCEGVHTNHKIESLADLKELCS